MKKLLLATAVTLATLSRAHASGWQAYYDCGNGVVPIISGWRGKMWLSVEDDHKTIFADKKFYDSATDTLDKNPEELTAPFIC